MLWSDGEVVGRVNTSCRARALVCLGGGARNRGDAECVWNMATGDKG